MQTLTITGKFTIHGLKCLENFDQPLQSCKLEIIVPSVIRPIIVKSFKGEK